MSEFNPPRTDSEARTATTEPSFPESPSTPLPHVPQGPMPPDRASACGGEGHPAGPPPESGGDASPEGDDALISGPRRMTPEDFRRWQRIQKQISRPCDLDTTRTIRALAFLAGLSSRLSRRLGSWILSASLRALYRSATRGSDCLSAWRAPPDRGMGGTDHDIRGNAPRQIVGGEPK